MPGLDVLRGLAILAVMQYHAIEALNGTQLRAMPDWFVRFASVAPFGHLGVHLFFVLSGFLITGLLFDSRRSPDYFTRFYVRRAGRILPAYLFMIALLLLTGSISLKYVLACLLFVCNMSSLVGAQNEYGPFWSLSVEEQFYLLWPLVLRRLTLRQFTWLCVLIVCLSPPLRWALQHAPHALSDINYKTWAISDCFGAGALAALYVRSRPRAGAAGAVVSLVGAIALYAQFSSTNWGSPLDKALYITPSIILFTGLVLLAYQFGGIARTAPGRAACFVGEISYGLYLVHEFVFKVVSRAMPASASPSSGEVALQLGVGVVLAVVMATVSRRTLEAYFLAKAKGEAEVRSAQADPAGGRPVRTADQMSTSTSSP
jgi:peptidoglycan/LPS O-acetylase OafA/YrhL